MKKLNKIILLLTALFMPLFGFTQDAVEVSMADGMRASGKIYVVVAVLAIIFLGIAFYLFTLDRKLGKLETEAETK